MDTVKQIGAVALFNGLSDQHHESLAKIAQVRKFKRGQIIFSEGDDGAGFYVIDEGRVKIFKVSPDGKEQILHIAGPGEPFAEVAVFTGAPYPAHSMALQASRLFFFPKETFVGLIKENPSLAMNMLASLSLRLKRFSRMIEALSLQEVPGRLAAHILYLSGLENDAADLKLEIAKAQLASLLGTIPETLSRILGKMSRRGLIKVDGPLITIMNRQGLAELAEGEGRLD